MTQPDQPFSWKPHLLALLGPIAVWGVLFFTHAREMDLFDKNLGAFLMGAIPGMSFGYLVCLFKLMPKKPPAPEKPELPLKD